jgi:hypothetical protein
VATVEVGLHFVGGGMFLDFLKKSRGVVKIQHAALGFFIFTSDRSREVFSPVVLKVHLRWFETSTSYSLVLFS